MRPSRYICFILDRKVGNLLHFYNYITVVSPMLVNWTISVMSSRNFTQRYIIVIIIIVIIVWLCSIGLNGKPQTMFEKIACSRITWERVQEVWKGIQVLLFRPASTWYRKPCSTKTENTELVTRSYREVCPNACVSAVVWNTYSWAPAHADSEPCSPAAKSM